MNSTFEPPQRPRVCIVSPAAAGANNGNWHTAARWQRFLQPVADSAVALDWQAATSPACDALIALHARRSAAAIVGFRAACPGRPIAVVLTGTDLYRDLQTDPGAQHALQCASHVVVLQPDGLAHLPGVAAAKACVIVQSAPRLRRPRGERRCTDFIAVGHLRDEKDPLTLMQAARVLPAGTPIRIVHVGRALDPALGVAAERTQRDCPHYRWLGEQPHAAARRSIAGAGALLHMSRIEGGANVVIEAVRAGVPVLASRIGGNLGLLGADYGGYFSPGDALALAGLMQRFSTDAAFAEQLAAQCAVREPGFAPAAERAAVRRLVADMLADSAAGAARGSG